MLPTTYDNPIIKGLLRLTAQQWTTLGVGLVADRPANVVIDPEALLWATFDIARHEPRQFDAVIDWLDQNHKCICIPRLKNIGPDKDDIRWRILSAVAAHLCHRKKRPSWRLLAQSQQIEYLSEEKQPLFLGVYGNRPPTFSVEDAIFAGRGLIRGKFENRNQSSSPDLDAPQALLLKAKSLFGSDARAYVWATLFTREGSFQSFISEQTGYKTASLSLPLQGFVESGICIEERRATAKWFRLTNNQAWRDLLRFDKGIPPWPNWCKLFPALIELSRTWTQCNQDNLSPYLLSSELRRVFAKVHENFFYSGIPLLPVNPDLYLAEDFLEPLTEYLQKLFSNLTEPS